MLALAAAAAAGLGVAFLMGGGGGEDLAALGPESPLGAPADPGSPVGPPARPGTATADRPLPPADLTGAAVEGRVVGPDGKLVAGATVTAVPDSPAARRVNTVTSQGGTYRLAGLPARSDVTLFASHADLAASEPATFETLEAGRALRAPDLVLRAGARVSGVVLDSGGAPVPGAEVSGVGDRDPDFEPVFDDNPSWTREKPEEFDVEPPHVTTGADGRFTLDRVTPGFWVFRATARGHGPAFSKPIELREGAAREGVTLRLPAGAALTGYVMAPGGRPIPRARVHARLTGEEVGDARSTTTDANGRFSIPGLLAREYEVSVAAEGYADWDGNLGAGRGDHTVTLHPHAALLVRVRDERAEGSPALKGFAVEAVAAGAEEAPGRVVDTRAGGVAESSPGLYRLDLAPNAAAVLAAGRLRVWVLLRDGRLAASAPTPPAPGGETEVEVRVPAGIVVPGTVKDSEGRPVPGARVTLVGPETWDDERGGTPQEWAALAWEGIRAERDGTFIVRLAGEGPWVLKAAAEGYETGTSRELRAGPGALAPADVAIVLKLPPARVVRGILRDSEGNPFPGAAIWLLVPAKAPGRRNYLAKTDGEGRFEFPDPVPAGRYQARLQSAGGQLLPLPEVEISETGAGDLELTAPGTPSLVRLSGVVLKNGDPWGGAAVGILGANWVIAGADGTFNLPVVFAGDAGQVLVIAARAGGAGLHTQVVAPGAAATPLRINLGVASARGRVSCAELEDLVGTQVEALEGLPRDAFRAGAGAPIRVGQPFQERAPIDTYGGFEFLALPAARVAFRLVAEGVDVPLGVLDLNGGVERTDLVWQADPIARIRARLLDSGGNPVAGATVRPLRARSAAGSSPTTGANGQFTLQLWARASRLVVQLPGRDLPGSFDLDWPESGVIERDFQLP